MDELSAPAPAKINLTLEILGKRGDGYHELRTVMQTLELADLVTIRSGGAPGVAVDGPFADGVPNDESNLAWRAARELAARTGKSTSDLRITITKRVPPAGGLGGGASDAATTLKLLERLWAVDDEASLLYAANAIGSDEAFFLSGGTALVEGRGDMVRKLPDLEERGVVLFVPHVSLEGKTAALFATFADQPFDDGARSAAFVEWGTGEVAVGDTYNAFERIAFQVFPGLGGLRAEVEAIVGAPVRLAGAGPTLFWIGPQGDADAVANKAAGIDCVVIRTSTAASLWKR